MDPQDDAAGDESDGCGARVAMNYAPVPMPRMAAGYAGGGYAGSGYGNSGAGEIRQAVIDGIRKRSGRPGWISTIGECIFPARRVSARRGDIDIFMESWFYGLRTVPADDADQSADCADGWIDGR